MKKPSPYRKHIESGARSGDFTSSVPSRRLMVPQGPFFSRPSRQSTFVARPSDVVQSETRVTSRPPSPSTKWLFSNRYLEPSKTSRLFDSNVRSTGGTESVGFENVQPPLEMTSLTVYSTFADLTACCRA